MLLEGLELILALWSGERVTFDGQYYHVKDAVCAPLPVTKPHPPLWFGEAHPLVMEACARYGQGWNSVPVPLDELERRIAMLDAACRAIGRDSAEIEKTLETQILVAPDRAALRARLNEMVALTPSGAPTIDDAGFRAFVDGTSDDLPAMLCESWLIGTPDEVKQQIEQRIAMGFSHFMLWFVDAPREDGMRLFMEQVAPALRP
jgi:alkanesulfonate monooxygenase SsuD/methylene tetrahydromethanopterin reductase-like flavin-dependent oxidoreductase (luciferase family)